MNAWEHMIVDIEVFSRERDDARDVGALERQLDALGDETWELVAVVMLPVNTLRHYMKRVRQ